MGIIAVIAVLIFFAVWRSAHKSRNIYFNQNVSPNMIVISPSFQNNGYIPQKFTCEGENINPELRIQDVPENAKSLALVMHDPDAPMPGGFTHWLIWNTNPKTTEMREGEKPSGSVESKNDGGKIGYTGPCPPLGHGVHHYYFKFYALDAVLNLPADASKKDLEAEIQKHLIAKAELVGLYSR